MIGGGWIILPAEVGIGAVLVFLVRGYVYKRRAKIQCDGMILRNRYWATWTGGVSLEPVLGYLDRGC